MSRFPLLLCLSASVAMVGGCNVRLDSNDLELSRQSLVPYPATVEDGKGHFELSCRTTISYAPGCSECSTAAALFLGETASALGCAREAAAVSGLIGDIRGVTAFHDDP